MPGTYTKLLRTSESSWGETNLTQLFKSDSPQAVFDAGDTKGPITVGLSYQGALGRFVIYSDLEWLRDVNFDIQANKQLLQNSILWLSGFDSNQADLSQQSVQLVPAKLFSQIMIGSLLVAEVILMFGLFIYFRRH